MPGNEVGDRAHNFLVQENLSLGQHSHPVACNWPSDTGLWVNDQKQIGSLGSFTKAYCPQQSGVELRHSSKIFPVPNGYNIMQTTERPEFSSYQSQIQHQNLNGYVYGHHDLQTRQGEIHRLGLDTEYDHENMNLRGLLLPEQTSKLHRSNGGQQVGLLQPVQQQQSGFSDIQNLQQQLMLKRMQELQRQKSMQQVDSSRQHNLVNQVSPFDRQPHTGFAHQQFDQSLYGLPVSSSMGQINPYPFGASDKALTRQMPIYGNSVTGNQYQAPGQGSNSWMNLDQIQQMKPAHQFSSQDLISHSELAQDEPAMASLDPEEEKILFGSDDNIWDAFGSDKPCDLLDDNEFASGPSCIQSGSWSALMQSAVAETTSSGTGLQDELTGLTSQNFQHPSSRHLSNNEIENSLQPFQCFNTTQVMHEEIGHGDAHLNSNVDMGPTSAPMGSPQFNEAHNLRNMQGGTRFVQLSSNNHQLNYWKHVEASVKSQHNLNHVSESSFNSSDSYQSASSHQLISDAGDPRAPFGQTTSGQRKFQYAKFGGQVPKVGQNMVEIYHKVDQSRDGGIARDLNSLEHNISSETIEPDYSDGSVGGLQRSQSSNSQGFGLHLGSPSQPIPLRDKGQSMLSSNLRDMGQSMLPSNLRDMGQSMLPSNLRDMGQSMLPSNLRDMGQSMLPSLSFIQETHHAGSENHNVGTVNAVFPSAKSQPVSGSQLNIPKSTFVGQEAGFLNSHSLSTKVDQGQMTNEPLKESKIDVLPVNPTTKQIDLEAFGRSLRTSNFQKNSLMNQMSVMQNLDHDPSNRVTKRLKQSDSFFNGQNESQTSVSSNIAERSHISPQMAPSWFDRYGTFENSQLTETASRVKSVDRSVNIDELPVGLKTQGQVSYADDTSQVAAISKNLVPSLVAFEQTPFLSMDAGFQNLVRLRPEKQIPTAVDFRPWLVELSGRPKNLKGICTGAVEWSKAANCLMEKVDDDGDIIEDVLLIAKPKRRLIVTSLLTQQLFRPPPIAVLSLDSCYNYESVVYYGARLTLGDACNLVSSATSLSDKSEQSEKFDGHHLSKVMENITSKARKLEDDFSRLTNRASILDLRVELEDIERFSIFNRFAKFHGVSKPIPQRYVTAIQMPPNLPDKVQCLSL